MKHISIVVIIYLLSGCATFVETQIDDTNFNICKEIDNNTFGVTTTEITNHSVNINTNNSFDSIDDNGNSFTVEKVMKINVSCK